MFKLYLLLIAVHYVSATVYVKAPCPKVKPVENFQLPEFNKGVWYELARYPNNIENRGNCVTMTVSNENERYSVNTSEIRDGKARFITGFHTISENDNNAGIIYLHSLDTKAEEVNHAFPIHVLAIDYNSYVVGYECKYDESTQTRHDYAWILSRSKELDESAKKAVDNVFASHDYIDKSKLEWGSYSEETCKINS